MIKICFSICLLSTYIYTADIVSLQNQKREFKRNEKKIINDISRNQNRVVILFKQYMQNDIDMLQKEYDLHLEKCLAKRVCIFMRKNKKLNLEFNIIKNNYSNIEDIQFYTIHQFKQY